MTIMKRPPICMLLVLLASVAQPYPVAQAAVGRTAGSFVVTPSGAAGYTIPLFSVPGAHGFSPSLALSYNSQRGNGAFGVGWSLAGLSSVYRCNQTVAQDGAAAPVTLTNSDRFCLGGQRLRLTSSENLSTYGQDGTTYQTEIADFSLTTAHGNLGGSGSPVYFTVQGRDGLTYEYGNTADSRPIADGTSNPSSWSLDKVSDRLGNTLMVVSYNTANGTAIPSTISWGPNGSGGYQYKVAIVYSPTTNPNTAGYVAGASVQNSSVASSITVTGPSQAVIKYYALTYTPSTTGRQTLTRVIECADTGQSNCLGPTTLSYQPGGAGLIATATTAASPLLYDFNGDGLPDAFYPSGTSYYVALNTGSGFATPINTGVPITGLPLVGDVLGTGSDGILAVNGGTYYYYTYQSTTNSFSAGVNTSATYTTGLTYVLTDISGDGLPDLVSVNTTTGVMSSLQNTSANGTASFAAPYGFVPGINRTNLWRAYLSSGSGVSAANLRSVDFNGDGRKDLLLEVTIRTPAGVGEYTLSYYYYELISQGANAAMVPTSLPFDSSAAPPVLFGNFNDDSCTDVVLASTVYYSACNGTIATTRTLPTPNPFVALDWDQDGRTDLLSYGSGSTAMLVHSNGTGFDSPQPTSFTLPTGCSFYVGDVDGDGLDDLGCGNAYYPHSQAGKPADLLSNVTDGYANSISPTYVDLANGLNSTYFSLKDAQGAYSNYAGPLYVVKQVTYSDPSNGGTYSLSHYYSGAWMSLNGRGFAGFGSHQVYDPRNSSNGNNPIWETFGYDRAFPYTGMLISDLVTQNNTASMTVSNTSWTPPQTLTPLDGTAYNQRWFPYMSASTKRNYEVGGPKNGQLIATSTTSYTFDNSGNATNVSTTVTDNDYGSPAGPASPYAGQSWTRTTATTVSADTGTNWCLNQPTQVAVTQSAPGTINRTRTVSYSPDYVHCRETQQVIEPSSSTYAVTEVYQFDSFGNINSVTVTAAGVSGSRQSTVNWGTTGQFPMSVTNALNQTTQYNYDFSFGFQTSVQDPNGIVTSWQDDAFGRKTQENRPDHTYTVWTYNDCANWLGCLVGSHGLALSHYVHNQDQSVQTDGTDWFDSVDRPLLSNQRMLESGTYARNEVRYDSLGHRKSQAMPCTFAAVGTACPYFTTYVMDAIGRVITLQRPVSQNNSGTTQTTSIQYLGRTTITTDPQGKVSTRVTTVAGTLGVSQDNNGYSQTFAYDAFGSLTSVTDSQSHNLLTATYDYGLQPYSVALWDTDLGTRTYTYNGLGELTNGSDGNGQSFSISYDPLSRPLVRTENLANGTADLTTTWTWGNTATGSWNIGRLATVSAASSAGTYTENYTFDSAGRLGGRTIVIPSDGSYSYGLAYNANTGLLDTLTYPVTTNGCQLAVQYGYVNGLLSTVTDVSNASPCGSTGTLYWQANSDNPRGQITQETLGNHVITTRAFDAVTGWMSNQQSGLNGGAALQNESYLYDEVGNLTQRQNNNVGLSENFYYDNLYRLYYSQLNGVTNLQMCYDNSGTACSENVPGPGNITSRSDVAAGGAWAYDSTHTHRVLTAGDANHTYTYDANGNALTRGPYAISWTSYNHPRIINVNASGDGQVVQFDYDQNHTRWHTVYSSSAGLETTYQIGQLMEKVVTAGATNYRHYIFAGGTKVAVYSRGSSGNLVRYVREDHLGGVSGIINADGSSYVKESFTAFGNRRGSCTWTGSPTSGQLARITAATRCGYTWQSVLGTMGLNDMQGRIEDAVTGRFLSPDPFVPHPDNTQSYNRYSYVMNNPLTYTDPSGFADDAPPHQYYGDTGEGDPSAQWEASYGDTVVTFDNPNVHCTEDYSSCWVGVLGDQSDGSVANNHPIMAFGNNPGPGRDRSTNSDSRGDQQIPCRAGVACYIKTPQGKQQQSCTNQYVCQRPQDPRCHQPLPGPPGPGGGTVSGNVQYIGIASASGGLTGAPNTGSIAFLIWLNNVRPGGSQDYKLTGQPGSEAAGNFNFGATGSVFFSNPITLLSGAGVVQLLTNPLNSSGGIPWLIPPYGDEQGDQVDITAGINAGC
jgi:RHS repeat-associated protein